MDQVKLNKKQSILKISKFCASTDTRSVYMGVGSGTPPAAPKPLFLLFLFLFLSCSLATSFLISMLMNFVFFFLFFLFSFFCFFILDFPKFGESNHVNCNVLSLFCQLYPLLFCVSFSHAF